MAGKHLLIPLLAASPTMSTAMANRFTKYAREPENVVRKKVEAEECVAIKQFKALWNEVSMPELDDMWGRYYTSLAKQIPLNRAAKTLQYSAKDIECLSIVLAEPWPNSGRYLETFYGRPGLFLSALINNCKEDDFVIYTSHFAEPIPYLGYKNRKNLTVHGDVGTALGDNMIGGTITVNGAVDSSRSGVVRIGLGMTGGQIHINGDIDGIDQSFAEFIRHGKIFHNGKLIVHK